MRHISGRRYLIACRAERSALRQCIDHAPRKIVSIMRRKECRRPDYKVEAALPDAPSSGR